jgi:membrane-associated phospholipid phosphatase
MPPCLTGFPILLTREVEMIRKYQLRFAWRRCALLITLAAVLGASAFAQTPAARPSPSPPPAPQTPSLESKFFSNLVSDQRAIWSAPFHWQKRDARWIVPLGLSTAALIASDRYTAEEVETDPARAVISRSVSRLGSLPVTGGMVAGLYLYGRASGNDRARETGLLAAEAVINTQIVVQALKAGTRRHRPLEGDGRGQFYSGGFSFPSGHAANAWAVAAVVAGEYHDKPLVRFGAYGLATAVSLSRFTGRKHYLSDALIGGAIGYGIGRFVYRTRHQAASITGGGDLAGARSAKAAWMPDIAPRYNPGVRDYGLMLTWQF